jgi:hypothetical protein
MRKRSFGFLLAPLLVLAVPREAEAKPPSVDIEGALGPGASASSWRGDAAVQTSLFLGLRFADLFSIDTLTRLGYATVDDRVLTYLSFGVTMFGRVWKLRPYARLALVHQHEETRSAISDDPGGAAFGVGNGIRHRGGFGGSLGVQIPLAQVRATEIFTGGDATSTYFPDPRGPAVYWGASLWLGANFRL